MAATMVFCLPHAGGGRHQYLSWGAALGGECAWIPLEYPGRFAREDEPAYDTFATAVRALAEEIREQAGGECVGLFGHSLGGSLAYEVGRRLRGYPEVAVESVVVSGAEPPGALRSTRRRLFELDDERLLDHLVELSGAEAGQDSALLREFLAQNLPLVRSDYRLHHSYRPQPGTTIDVPLWICWGTEDELADRVGGWRAHAASTIEFRAFPGGHFYWRAGSGPPAGPLREAFARSTRPTTLPAEDTACLY